MKKYNVTLIKYENYEVVAENAEAAVDIACDICDEDVYAFFGPIDDYKCSVIEENTEDY